MLYALKSLDLNALQTDAREAILAVAEQNAALTT